MVVAAAAAGGATSAAATAAAELHRSLPDLKTPHEKDCHSSPSHGPKTAKKNLDFSQKNTEKRNQGRRKRWGEVEEFKHVMVVRGALFIKSSGFIY